MTLQMLLLVLTPMYTLAVTTQRATRSMHSGNGGNTEGSKGVRLRGGERERKKENSERRKSVCLHDGIIRIFA